MRQTTAPVTIAIVLINCLVFIYVQTMLDGVRETQNFLYDFGLNPTEFWIHQKVWQPLTSMFLHQHIIHFAFNMLAVWSVGTPLEMTLSSGRFTFLYLISGLTGSLFLLIFNADSNVPAIGASGAVFGLLGALAIFYPQSRLLVFFIPMRAITAAAVLAVLSIGLYLFQQLTFIAHMAHLGGLVGGLLYSKFALGLAIGKSDLGIVPGVGSSSGREPGDRGSAPARGAGFFDRTRAAPGATGAATPALTRAARAEKEAEILRLMRGISDEPAPASEADPIEANAPDTNDTATPATSPEIPQGTGVEKVEKSESVERPPQPSTEKSPDQIDPAAPRQRLEYDPKTGRFNIKN